MRARLIFRALFWDSEKDAETAISSPRYSICNSKRIRYPARRFHQKFTDTARRIAEITNVRLPKNTPYVGKAAFMHKGGMHGDGVMKYSPAFEHIDPSVVGNERSFPISEVAGRAIFLKKRKTFSPTSPSIKNNPTPFSKTERNGNAGLSV